MVQFFLLKSCPDTIPNTLPTYVSRYLLIIVLFYKGKKESKASNMRTGGRRRKAR